jgi:hypothetical protein
MSQKYPTKRASRLLAVLACLLTISPAFAEEGGGSHYLPGSLGDFAMALIGPPGFYVRNDTYYVEGSINGVTLGNRVYTSAKQQVWIDTIKGIYMTKAHFLGGRVVTAISLPIVLNAHVSGDVAFPIAGTVEANRTGLADITLTGFLNWTNGNSHYSAGVNVYAPAGFYSASQVVNTGRNYWSTVPTFSYTYLNPKKGHEVSFTSGVLFNSTNGATDYHTGTELYTDFMLSQHFSPTFAVGLEGYTLRQLTADSGPLLNQANYVLEHLGLNGLGGFEAYGFGLGPAVLWAPKIHGMPVNFIFKCLPDIVHHNRFNSTTTSVSIAFKI